MFRRPEKPKVGLLGNSESCSRILGPMGQNEQKILKNWAWKSGWIIARHGSMICLSSGSCDRPAVHSWKKMSQLWETIFPIKGSKGVVIIHRLPVLQSSTSNLHCPNLARKHIQVNLKHGVHSENESWSKLTNGQLTHHQSFGLDVAWSHKMHLDT